MERREPGFLGTLFAFGSPLLVGLLALYESIEQNRAAALPLQTPSTVTVFPKDLNLSPLAFVILGWLGLSIVLQIVAWFMNGRGTLVETLGTIGRMVGTLGAIEAIRLVAVLNGLNEWVGVAWFCAATLFVLGWTGRAWGKLHLLSRKETLVVTMLCFYSPLAIMGGMAVLPLLELLA